MRLASRQRGYFSAAQALEAGYSYQAQHFHAQHGNWIKVDRAVYRLREFLYVPSDGDDDYVRWSLWSRGRAVISHASSLSVHDLGVANPDRVHLTVPSGFRQRSPATVLHHAELSPEEVEERMGFRVTTPLRAIVESAEIGMDQDLIDSAIADLLERGQGTRRQLRHLAGKLGPRAELAIERALREAA